VRYLLAVLVFSMSLAVNAPAESLAGLGVDRGILMGALIATVVTGLWAFRDLAFVCLILILAIGANLPAEVAGYLGIDTGWLLATLFSLVVILVGRRFLGYY
jgi:hypothetical protein